VSLLLGLRVLDLSTDWGVFSLSIKAERFKFLMHEDGKDYEAFEDASATFCAFSTLLFIPDILAFIWKAKAQEAKLPPPPSAQIITAVVTVLEDCPQLLLGIVYLDVMRRADESMCDEYRQGTDGLAVFSTLVTLMAIATNVISLLKPEWFFNYVDKGTGERLPAMDGPIENALKTLTLRSAGATSVRKGKSNPAYEANFAATGYLAVEASPAAFQPCAFASRQKKPCNKGAVNGKPYCPTHTCPAEGCEHGKGSKAVDCGRHKY